MASATEWDARPPRLIFFKDVGFLRPVRTNANRQLLVGDKVLGEVPSRLVVPEASLVPSVVFFAVHSVVVADFCARIHFVLWCKGYVDCGIRFWPGMAIKPKVPANQDPDEEDQNVVGDQGNSTLRRQVPIKA